MHQQPQQHQHGTRHDPRQRTKAATARDPGSSNPSREPHSLLPTTTWRKIPVNCGGDDTSDRQPTTTTALIRTRMVGRRKRRRTRWVKTQRRDSAVTFASSPFSKWTMMTVLILLTCCVQQSASTTSPSMSGDDDTVHLQVVEGQAVGTRVGRIPTKPGFAYRFSDPPPEFSLNSTSGVVSTAAVLDREALRSDRFDLVVLSSQPTYPVEVRIRVLDVNDNAPTFPEPEIRVSFSESASPGTRVILDTANDSDLGNNSAVAYALVAGNEDDRFRLVVVTHPSGQTPYLHLETVAALDREARDAYRLNISARDGGQLPLSGFLLVNVSVLDVNDNPPIFDHSDYAVSLNESVPPGTSVLRVRATDADLGPNARVAYYLGEGETQFTVDSDTGEISTQETLHCPKHCAAASGGPCARSCVFTVFARDHGAPRQDGRAYVTVNLVDANDNDPRISFRYNPPSASFGTVDENAQNGTIVAAVSVVDPDEGPSGETRVRIVAGNELHHFRLERNHDVDIVRVNSALDRERIPRYNLTVVAVDGGSPPRSATAFLAVVVNDVNDHAPVFERTDYAVLLSELAPLGSYVASVAASDDDTGINSRLAYEIASGNADGWFLIDPASGLVTTAAPLDRERRATVALNISARDGGPNPRWAYAGLTVTIRDENDETPTFSAPTIRMGVAENTLPDTLLATLTATDDDSGANGTVTYALADDTDPMSKAHVRLDERTGRLYTNAVPLDREKASQHVVRVVATDGAAIPKSSTVQVILDVQDENDNDPVFYPVLYLSEMSNEVTPGTLLTTLKVHDPDEGINGRLTYTLHGDRARHFRVRSDASVEATSTLTWGDTDHFRLTVSAKDGGGRKCPTDAVIVVVRKRSRPLRFRQQHGYHFRITEDDDGDDQSSKAFWPRPLGEVGVTHTNDDKVKYILLDGDPTSTFSIDETSGVIASTEPLDRETHESYTLKVLAILTQSPSSFAFTTINVSVLDLNDNPPAFPYGSVTVHVSENLPVGYEVYSARANDPDINSTTTYRLLRNPENAFVIDAASGTVSLAQVLDYEQVQRLTAVIVATDAAAPTFSTTLNVTFVVDDVNDHTPTFTHLTYETSLSESTPVNTRFHAFRAADGDDGLNGRVSYGVLEADDAPFAIFPDGYLYVSAALDRETRDYYELTVTAKDHGTPPRESSVDVVIRILDENDNAPVFRAPRFNFSVAENQPAGTYVGQLRATDADAGRNAQLAFALSGDQRDFSVDERSGVIRTRRPFDRERGAARPFSLDAVVTDRGLARRRRAEARVTVVVTDVNDNAPRFSRTRYEASVSEGAALRSHVVRVSANDDDQGDNGRITYDIRGGDDEGCFRIDNSTGRITLAKPLDRERVERYALRVVATDGGPGTPLSSTATVSVVVLDDNDNAPRFIGSSASGGVANVAEDSPVGWTVATFAATDDDSGANGRVRFSLSSSSSSSAHDAFRVDATSGAVTVDKPLDREQKAQYKLNVTATDDGSPRLASYATLLVRVLDVNDNAPSLLRTPATRKVKEGIGVGSVVFNATADDPDEGANGRVTFRLGGQRPPGPHFAIDPATGVVMAAADIDREFAAAFELTVVATDGGGLSAERRVTVFVEDVNDNSPVFVSPATAVLKEAAGKGHVVTTVSAIDEDAHENGQVTYDLLGAQPASAASTFAVDRHSGNVYLNGPLPTHVYTFNLSVRASDGAPPPKRRHTDTAVTILFLPPSSASSGLSFRLPRYEATVAENVTVGTALLDVDLAPSSSSRTVKFFLASVMAAPGEPRPAQPRPFSLDARTAHLATAAVLDRDAAATRYTLTVLAVDDAQQPPNVASTTVAVSVLDKNDSPPTFASDTFQLEANEQTPTGTLLATLSASDPDKTGTLSYSLIHEPGTSSHDPESFLSIDGSTGALSLCGPLDRERASQHWLRVVASDGVHETSATVQLQVLDANDNAPAFDHPAYAFDIREDAIRGETVGRLGATDADDGLNAKFKYALVSDGGTDAFLLDAETGVITLRGKLDYEQTSLHVLVASATDGGVPALSATVTVYVNVLDANDNGPLFDPVSYSNRLPENVPAGTTVLAVTATDQDDGDNGRIEYELEPGDDASDFKMTADGRLLTANSLDRERQASYRLTVVAIDSAKAPERQLRSTAHVHVALTDVNDNPPVFTTPNVTSVVENMPSGTVVVSVRATDADEGVNGQVEYSLISSKSEGGVSLPPFVIGPVDGLLRTTSSLDREKIANYTVMVGAKDRGIPAKEARMRLTVHVADENDNAPRFQHRRYSASVAENASLGSSVAKVLATDADDDRNGRVRYKIVAGDPNRDFAVGEYSGAVRIAKPLDYENQATYVLSVRAEDEGHDARHDTATVTVAVGDVNDNPPTFADSPYVVNVMENAPAPAPLADLQARDADAPSEGQKPRYFLKDGDRSLFAVEAATGRVSARTSLDRERQDAHRITIIAVDSGTPRLTGTGTLFVVVMDVNDNTPVFDKEIYSLEVEENQPPDTRLLKIHATDADVGNNAHITYSLMEDDASDRFQINSSTGWLSSRVLLDYEERSSYRLTAMAVDSSPTRPLTATTTISIIIKDVNDNPPTFEKDTYDIAVAIPVIKGQFLFGCTAVDVDFGNNGRVFYELLGPDANQFQVNTRSGVVHAGFNFTNVSSSSFVLTMAAHDGGYPVLRANATVRLKLRPEGTIPVIRNATSDVRILESVTHSTVASVTVPSTKSLFSYNIIGGNIDGVFAVDNGTGRVNVTSGLDFETVPRYELWIEARSAASPSVLFLLNVTILDVNDNHPQFVNATYNVSLMEEEPPPQQVVVVQANDADSGSNGIFTYQLRTTGNNQDSLFSIDAHTGRVTTHSKLDREAMGIYTLTVEAVDKGRPPNTGSATILVTVLDKNDNPPRFTRLFSANITENSAVGTFVIQVTSSDRDVGINANAVYSFTENPGSKFHIDPASGNVTVAGEIDREEAEEYILKVSAVDGSWRAETPLTITVQDINDNEPKFTNLSYIFAVPELQRAVSFVGTVSAIDKDKGGPNSYVSYSLKQSSDLFEIEASSGDIYTKKTMRYKRENDDSYSLENQFTLRVVATDHGRPPLSSECQVIVHVIGANEHGPVFQKSSYFSPLPPAVRVGDSVLQIQATDEMDVGINAKVNYQVIEGNGSTYIGIDASTGWLYLRSPLNATEKQSMLLIVRATDGGLPPRHADCIVQLIITNDNQFSPTFTSSNYQVIIPENEILNSEIFRVTASDNDPGINGEIFFSITSGNAEECFKINATTGTVSISKALDYERTQEYQLQITATDKAFNASSAIAVLTVVVTDINDNPPVFNQTSYHVIIKENQPRDIVICRVIANDSDSGRNAAIQYSLSGGEEKSHFSIDLQSGVLVTKISFDYEKKQMYVLEVTASNPDTVQYSSCTVTVQIEGENEFYPRFLRSKYHFTVSETATIGTRVGMVSATDQDEGPDGWVYYLLFASRGNSGFAIDAQSGIISVVGNLRGERTSPVVFTALAKNKEPVRGNDTDEAEVIITLRKGNNAPAFGQSFYDVGISEDAAIGEKLVSVTVSNKNNDPRTGAFLYSIVSGNEDNVFRMESESGTVLTSRSLDHETMPSYNLTVGAFESDFSPPVATATIMVRVHDVNDNGPHLQQDQLNASVSENEAPGAVVTTLVPMDPDGPNFGPPFTFHLNASGTSASVFNIDSKTGIITTKITLDRESTSQYIISVKVTDAGKPPMSSDYDIRINVLDVNDNPPSTRNAAVIVHTVQGMNYKSIIADVHPLDPDETNQFDCHIIGGNVKGSFSIANNCNLHMQPLQNDTNANLNISGRDGQHRPVVSQFKISISNYPSNFPNHLVDLRILNLSAVNLVSNNYYSFLKLLNEIFEGTKHHPILFAVSNSTSQVDLLIGAFTEQNKIVPKKEIITILNSGKNKIKKMFQPNEFVIGHEACRDVYCLNGGRCEGQTTIVETFAAIDTPNLIVTSPMILDEHRCECPSAFSGPHCDSQLDPCHPNPCPSGRSCIRQDDTYRCSCVGKEKCQDSCSFNPCRNGGTCQESLVVGVVVCSCRKGFTGTHCENPMPTSCFPNPCQNGGTCTFIEATISCNCKNGFSGSRCQQSPPIGFDDLSYAVFHVPGSNIRELSVVFASTKNDGLLIRRFDTMRQQFFALNLINGRLELSVSGSGGPITTLANKQHLRGGKWYMASVTFISKIISLSVSECTDQGLQCDECTSHDCYSEAVPSIGSISFDTELLYVGGLPSNERPLLPPPLDSSSHDLSLGLDHDFVGCIQRASINGYSVDLTRPVASAGLTNTCSVAKSSTTTTTTSCANNSCVCGNGLVASDCTEAFQTFSISDGTYIMLEPTQQFTSWAHNLLRVQWNECFSLSFTTTSTGTFQTFSISDGTYIMLEPTQQFTSLTRSTYATSWPSMIGMSIQFRTTQQTTNLLHSTSHDGGITMLRLQDGVLLYSSQIEFSSINISLHQLQASDGQWHNVSMVRNENSITVSIDDASKTVNATKIHNFLDRKTNKLIVGGFTDRYSNEKNDLPMSLEGCLSTLVVNGHVQPFEGEGNVLRATIHGKLSRGCAGAVQSQDAAPTDPLSVGVTLVIVFFIVLMVAIMVSFIVYRHRRLKRDKLEGHGSHAKTNGGPLLPGGGLDPSRHQHDGGTYLDNPDGPGDSDGLHGHLALHDVANKKHKELNEIPQRPDIIEREMVNKSPIVSSSPPHDEGRKLGGLLPSEMGVPDSEAPEHYDLENASSIAPSDIDIVYHYKSYRDGNVRKYKATNNPHPPNFHHAHKHAPHVAYAANQRNSPHSLLRHSPASALPTVARDSPGALKMQSTPLARLSPSSELSQQTPRILTLQDISGRPLQSALLATAPPGGVKDALASSERSLHSPISQLSRSTTSRASTHGVTGPVSSTPGSNADAKGLTADDIERLNARPRNSSLVSTLDAVSSSSSSSGREPPARNTPATHQLAQLLETNTELLEGADDSSSDESGNDSFTCSEFEYDNNYERASREFGPGNMIFSKLAEVDNENDEESTKNFDSFDSFHGSLSTLVASDDDDDGGSNTSHYKPTNGAHLGWDYLLNWGPNFESLVGVFKDLAELPDALRAKTQGGSKPDEEYL